MKGNPFNDTLRIFETKALPLEDYRESCTCRIALFAHVTSDETGVSLILLFIVVLLRIIISLTDVGLQA